MYAVDLSYYLRFLGIDKIFVECMNSVKVVPSQQVQLFLLLSSLTSPTYEWVPYVLSFIKTCSPRRIDFSWRRASSPVLSDSCPSKLDNALLVPVPGLPVPKDLSYVYDFFAVYDRRQKLNFYCKKYV